MMTVPTVKTVILTLERIWVMLDGEDEKLHNQSHDWDDFYSLLWDSSCYSPILL